MGITSLVKSKQAKCGFSSFWRLFWLWLHSPTPNPAPPEQATCAHVSQPLAVVSASELVAGLLLDVWMGLLLGLGPTGLGHVLGRGTMLETAMGVRLTLRVRRPTCAETTRPTRAGALITPSVGCAVCGWKLCWAVQQRAAVCRDVGQRPADRVQGGCCQGHWRDYRCCLRPHLFHLPHHCLVVPPWPPLVGVHQPQAVPLLGRGLLQRVPLPPPLRRTAASPRKGRWPQGPGRPRRPLLPPLAHCCLRQPRRVQEDDPRGDRGLPRAPPLWPRLRMRLRLDPWLHVLEAAQKVPPVL